MKEATGELSTTVIAIVAIAAILAIFTAFLLPMMRSQIALTQACNGGPGYTAEHVCCTTDATGTCNVTGAKGDATASKTCNAGDKNGAAEYKCFYYNTEK